MEGEKVLARPEEPLSESIARISFDGDWVQVFYPEKRDSFKRVVKRLNYGWKRPYWAREVKDTAVRLHRAAELARDLLAANFCVKADRTLIDMVLAEEFVAEVRRKVLAVASGEYEGWFKIWWKRDEDMYHAAKRLPGARYDRPHVVVPPESFEAVLDFAEMYDFAISDEALVIVAEAEAELESAIVVSVKVADTAVAPPYSKKPRKLTIPDVVEIDDALADHPL